MSLPKRKNARIILLVFSIILFLFVVAGAAQAKQWIVCIDPGHQAQANYTPEPIGPGDSQTKPSVAPGTRGKISGREYGVVLDIGLRLRDLLVDAGTSVVMTRTSNDVNVTNVQRAQIANAAHADLFIRLHCNGSRDPATSGCFTLYPANIQGWTDDVYARSLLAAQIIQPLYAAKTKLHDRGIMPRADLSGFNWSDVPVVLVEMLHQTNPVEDQLASQPSFRQTMAEGLRDGVLAALRALSERKAEKAK
jgi:N-acetylmuramoyl-L-alanine amidase